MGICALRKGMAWGRGTVRWADADSTWAEMSYIMRAIAPPSSVSTRPPQPSPSPGIEGWPGLWLWPNWAGPGSARRAQGYPRVRLGLGSGVRVRREVFTT